MSWDLPFTREQFFAVFAAYNEAIWPAQAIAYALGIAALAFALRREAGRTTQRAIALALAVMWAWTGVAYHWVYFSAINEAALFFGALFVGEAMVLAFVGAARGRLRFAGASRIDAGVGLALAVYALAIYPLIGIWTEQGYAAIPMFGVTPCPVTIFTFALLLLTQGRVRWSVVALPLVWAAIGGSAAFLLGVVQDWMLPISAAVCAALLVRRA